MSEFRSTSGIAAMEMFHRPDEDTINYTGDNALSSRAPLGNIKRILDVLLALIALLFFGPLMLIVALLIKVFDPGPVLFSQERIGLYGRTFRCLKFRTMVVDADGRLAEVLKGDAGAQKSWNELQKLTVDPRVTSIGNFLRLSSLDELPQFFNVLRGDMSIVGPRPIVGKEVARYGRYFDAYCSVRPGLTGMWQVSGRNATTYRRRVALDVVYARKQNLLLDLWVMSKTPGAILSFEGVY